MLTEEQKHNALIDMMEVLEKIDQQIAMTHAVEHIPAEYATHALWESIREMMPQNRELLEKLKETIQIASKIIDNDAVTAHLSAVITAP